MTLSKPRIAIAASFLLAGCSAGPHFEAALPQVRNIPVLANLSPAASMTQARSFLAARQYGLAIELFKTASRDPALKADSLNGLGIAYDGIGRPDLAERYFQQALAARPDDVRVRSNLARFYIASGQREKHRALLAESNAPDARDPAIIADVQSIQASYAGVEPEEQSVAPTVVLGEQSPLSTLFEPLLVSASLPPKQGTGSAGSDNDVLDNDISVVCTAVAAAASGGPMTMFRVGIGEVFIAPQPVGATCTVTGIDDHAPGTAKPGHSLSNTEYLGLVAAQLDQFNNRRVATDISLLWRLAFGLSEPA